MTFLPSVFWNRDYFEGETQDQRILVLLGRSSPESEQAKRAWAFGVQVLVLSTVDVRAYEHLHLHTYKRCAHAQRACTDSCLHACACTRKLRVRTSRRCRFTPACAHARKHARKLVPRRRRKHACMHTCLHEQCTISRVGLVPSNICSRVQTLVLARRSL